ncbi:hypothetical protein Agub_g1395, partial [Astrephomene gubernaculifera]
MQTPMQCLVSLFEDASARGCMSSLRVPQGLRRKIQESLRESFVTFDPGFWVAVVGLHRLAAELLVSKPGEDGWSSRILHDTGKLILNLCSINCEEARCIAYKVALALLEGDLLHAAARLFAKIYSGIDDVAKPDEALVGAMISCAHCAGVLLGMLEGTEGSVPKDLFLRYAGALHTSHVLEHMSRALLAVVKHARSQESQRLTFMSKGSLAKILRASLGGILRPWMEQGPRYLSSPGWMVEERDLQAALYKLCVQLSEPCLQFILGWLVTTERLSLAGGEGPRYGLPEELLTQHEWQIERDLGTRLLLESLASVA